MLTTAQLSKRLNVRPQTVRLWRLNGRGPRFVRLGSTRFGRVLYDEDDVQDWLAKRKHASTAEETCAHGSQGEAGRVA
jgi:hypothetical protein